VFRLSSMPNVCEATTVAIAAKVAGSAIGDMPWGFAFTLGFVLSAVSPAVVVPSLLDLQNRGYGVDKGIPSMVLASASLDDVLAICAFGISSSLAFVQAGVADESASDEAWLVLRAPVELVGGVLAGVMLGIVLIQSRQITPPLASTDAHEKEQMWHLQLMLLLLVASGLGLVFVAKQIKMPGGGYLAAMTVATTVAQRWDGSLMKYTGALLGRIWASAQPFLFGLIGAAVRLDYIKGDQIATAVAIIVVGLIVRVGATYASVCMAGLEQKEKVFVAIAWSPKATVQAAIGPEVLHYALLHGASAEVIAWGEFILTTSVLAILLTAPLGAIGIASTGPRWLVKSESVSHKGAAQTPAPTGPTEEKESEESVSKKGRLSDIGFRVRAGSDPSKTIAVHKLEDKLAHV